MATSDRCAAGAVNVVTQTGERARLEPLGGHLAEAKRLLARALAVNGVGNRVQVREYVEAALEQIRAAERGGATP